LDRWVKERRRKEKKKKASLERQKQEREERVEGIRRGNLEKRERKSKERAVDGGDEEDGASARSHVRNIPDPTPTVLRTRTRRSLRHRQKQFREIVSGRR
jgi:hypothetical protein